MKHIIIGGVAGGATAAARIRRIDESAEIVLIEKGEYISYANCGLPYYIGGVIKDRSRLFVQTPESFGTRFNVNVRIESEVTGIDTANKKIRVKKKDGSEYEENYDKLLLSPGSVPVKPPLEGIDSEGIFTLRNVEDTDHIKNYMESHPVRKAVVVGGGFIGLEMAENLYNAGLEVSIIEMSDQVMAPVDYSIAAFIHRHLTMKGVRLHLSKGVRKFERINGKITVWFGNDEKTEADIVVLSIGVRPATALASAAGLKIGEAKGIWVDSHLETSAKDVYAVGDAIEFPNPITGKPWLNYLANPANRQGRVVADNMVLGNKETYEGAIGTCIAKVFDITVGSTGLPAKKLQKEGIRYLSSVTHSSSHAGYYPGAMPITIKLTFSPDDGRIYGAQCVGSDGIDKRIDQISLLIKRGGTVYDLQELEQAYAPPFSSAKDPIAIAGYVAGNILNGTMPVIDWRKMRTLDKKENFVIDVRTPLEHEMGNIPDSVNIPLDEMRGRLNEIPAGKPIVVYCQIGLRGYLAQRILLGHGFKDVRNLQGGFKTYETAVAPLGNAEYEAKGPGNAGIETDTQRTDKPARTVRVDACGLSCPGPIVKMKENVDTMSEGERLEVTATDPGFARDAEAWCKSTGNVLISQSEKEGVYTALIEKRKLEVSPAAAVGTGKKAKTLIMFSDDLDRAIATFVLANGAAATGSKVSIFFTFWGLNVIKKSVKPKVKKDFFGRMFGMMLPSDSRKLSLSKMNMCGIGSKMMRNIMKRKKIESVESMRDQAQKSGVEFIACQMSMDVMGITKEELLDGVTIGGVATYMERADNANMSLFI
ncbi:MAG: FAD-dependent oxidoreductase [Bacteroidales bacterium]|jgi:NADPH-dependent 2,4-dienoyl-CoA reductase/sulfur reductase-like enzyme/peroxiredoxin family protein/rhodanese-related sulfurtransferase/TusA-related sulfurtransferase|nr:FAD-dependent oxidoreductase [Bacteroidales bacterium]MCI2121905.1 FAD-dependent oxidoreductase [Bacteroidales bacterium]MCI2146100.1 FAD-dependent oxidoreductase [Bacteroidales bacterium]